MCVQLFRALTTPPPRTHPMGPGRHTPKGTRDNFAHHLARCLSPAGRLWTECVPPKVLC